MRDSGAPAGAEFDTVQVQTAPVSKFKTAVAKTNSLINFVGMILFRLRKVVLAAPVVYAALQLAQYNREHLPEQVGINIQSSGEFAQMISRDLAVMGPLGLTAACLLLMFCSRKARSEEHTSELQSPQ